MNKIEQLKKELIDISNKLNLSDGELLDTILDKTSERILSQVIEQLQEWELTEKLRKYFDLRYIDKIERTPDGYPDEYTIYTNNKVTNIEVVSRATAIRNELDFIDSIEESNEFLKEMAIDTDPSTIGMYKRIESNLYYREL